MKRSEIYKVIDNEREYQNSQWGEFHDRDHNAEAFILYIEHYITEARRAITTEKGIQGGLTQLRKVVALGVACFEEHGVPEREIK